MDLGRERHAGARLSRGSKYISGYISVTGESGEGGMQGRGLGKPRKPRQVSVSGLNSACWRPAGSSDQRFGTNPTTRRKHKLSTQLAEIETEV